MSNGSNNWNVSFGAIAFFERALKSHQKVRHFTRTEDIYFSIERSAGYSPVFAVLVDVYTVVLAHYLKAREEFPQMDCLVTCANWNAYTREAKERAIEDHMGLFIVGEFFGALWAKEPYKYAKKDDKGRPIYHYRAA
jgi:hypothetical protein